MLLDNVPHECYGKIKLCRTMIQVQMVVLVCLVCEYQCALIAQIRASQDHFIPSYAKNMDSALHTLIETFVLPQHVADAQQAQQAD